MLKGASSLEGVLFAWNAQIPIITHLGLLKTVVKAS